MNVELEQDIVEKIHMNKWKRWSLKKKLAKVQVG